MKKLDLLAATALTLLLATPAVAQDTAAPAAAEDDYQSDNEIVVTATLRNETVQDVPVAITAVGSELLDNAGVQDIRGLEQLAPSLQTTSGQSAATASSLSIRGVGTAGDNPGFEPAVGVFIDGVFRSRAGIALAELPELERVEILRGPQGTLFGRNTSAGALRVFTAQPSFTTSGYAEASFGNYQAIEIEGGVTGPVSEQVALRLDGGYRTRDGYINDVNTPGRAINDINRWNVRGQALIDSGDLTIRLIADYAKTDEQCCGAVNVVRGALAPVIEGVAAVRGLDGMYNGAPSERRQAMSPNRGYAEAVNDGGVSAEINWDLGGVTMTSITAYRSWEAVRDQDIDFSGIDRAYRKDYRVGVNNFTQELRFQGSSGILDWMVGGFYLKEDLELTDTVRFGNDANLYVDSIFNALAGPSFGGSVQFYGSRGPTSPTPGAVFLNPAVPNSLPALQAVYGATLAPLVGCFRAQAGTAPAGLCVIPGFPAAPIPGLAALAASPLPGVVPGQGNNNDEFGVKTDAFSLFTHNIVNVTDKLALTLGVRWNHETKNLAASINNDTGSCAFFNNVRAGQPAATAYANLLRQLGLFNNLYLLSCNPAVNTEFNGNYAHKRSTDKITGTAKLSFKATDDLMFYGSYDRGYKSGGYNLDQATFDSVLLGGNGPQAGDLEFGDETVDSFEIGAKFSPNRVFTFNAALFYGKYHDLQNLVFSGNNFVVQNIDSSTSRGVEIETVVRPNRDLTMRVGYTYLDAKYDASNNFTGTPLAGLEGQQVQNQPKNVLNGAITFTPSITDDIKALIHVDARYQSEVEISGRNTATTPATGFIRNGAYALINARVGLQSADGKIKGEFFVENVTNQFYFITGFAVPEQTGTYAGYPGYPRFYGARIRLGF